MRGQRRKFLMVVTALIFALFVAAPSGVAAANDKHPMLGLNISDSDKTEIARHVKQFKIKGSVKKKNDGQSAVASTSTAANSETDLGAAPSQIDWSGGMPAVGDQGSQNSCVGWSMAYAYRSFQEQVQRSWGLGTTSHLFSPSYIYNQLNGGTDGGCSPVKAANLLVSQGCDTLDDMPYNSRDYKTQPTPEQIARAGYFKSASWASVAVNDPAARIDNLKAALTNTPLQAGFYVYWNTGWDSSGNINSADLASGTYAGSHSVMLVGYDDSHATADGIGAFKILNSWGSRWGQGGYGWISYEYANQKLIEAIAITDITDDPVMSQYSLSGTACNSDGTALPGANIDFKLLSGTGNVPAATVTDASGIWKQENFESGATYRVTPSKEGYVFSPAYIDVSSSNAGTVSLCFKATATPDEIIINPPALASLTVVSPELNSVIKAGTSSTIKWTFSGPVAKVNIQLIRDGLLAKTIASNVSVNKRSYKYLFPRTLSEGVYQIKLIDSSDASVYDDSDPFNIVVQAAAKKMSSKAKENESSPAQLEEETAAG